MKKEERNVRSLYLFRARRYLALYIIVPSVVYVASKLRKRDFYTANLPAGVILM
jgi:hypothetical protein